MKRNINGANSSNATVTVNHGIITIEGGKQGKVTMTFNGDGILIETIQDPNAKMAEALASCYLKHKASGAQCSKAMMSIKFCHSIRTDKEIADFKESIAELVSPLKKKIEDTDQVIQYLQNYIYSSNLFEVLGVVKKLPNDHAASIFNQDISGNILSYLTTTDILFNVSDQAVAVTGDNVTEGDGA